MRVRAVLRSLPQLPACCLLTSCAISELLCAATGARPAPQRPLESAGHDLNAKLVLVLCRPRGSSCWVESALSSTHKA